MDESSFAGSARWLMPPDPRKEISDGGFAMSLQGFAMSYDGYALHGDKSEELLRPIGQGTWGLADSSADPEDLRNALFHLGRMAAHTGGSLTEQPVASEIVETLSRRGVFPLLNLGDQGSRFGFDPGDLDRAEWLAKRPSDLVLLVASGLSSIIDLDELAWALAHSDPARMINERLAHAVARTTYRLVVSQSSSSFSVGTDDGAEVVLGTVAVRTPTGGAATLLIERALADCETETSDAYQMLGVLVSSIDKGVDDIEAHGDAVRQVTMALARLGAVGRIEVGEHRVDGSLARFTYVLGRRRAHRGAEFSAPTEETPVPDDGTLWFVDDKGWVLDADFTVVAPGIGDRDSHGQGPGRRAHIVRGKEMGLRLLMPGSPGIDLAAIGEEDRPYWLIDTESGGRISDPSTAMLVARPEGVEEQAVLRSDRKSAAAWARRHGVTAVAPSALRDVVAAPYVKFS